MRVRVLVLIGLLLLSSTSFADTLITFFEVPPTDQSLGMLRMIFGDMGSVLPGQENAFNFMFKSFNEAMLVLSVFVVAYTTIFGLINTAHEGEFLGKKLNSVWVPIRTVLGLALLVPTKTGYCLIQIFMMWIVLQGVGAADTIWSSALSAIQVEGSRAIIPSVQASQNPSQTYQNMSAYNASAAGLQMLGLQPPPPSINQTLTFETQNQVTQMFTSLACVHAYIQAQPGSLTDNWVPTSTTNTTTNKVTYDFSNVTVGSTTFPTSCGKITYDTPSAAPVSSPDYYQNQALATAIPYALGILNTSAKLYIQSPNTPIAGQPLVAVSNYIGTQLINAYNSFMEYESDNMSISSETAICNPAQPNTLTCAATNGWAYAGAYYRVLTTQSGTSITFTEQNLNVEQPYNTNPPSFFTPSAVVQAFQSSGGSNVSPGLSALQGLNGQNIANDFGTGTGAPLSVFTNWIVQAFTEMLSGSNSDLVDGQFIPSGSDPVQGVQNFGEHIVNTVELIWFILIVVLITGVIIAGICPGFNPLYGVIFILLKVASFFLFFFGIFLGAGLLMSVYVPLVPFLVFFFGVLGWLMAVIETMLAAPMVAMGITYPEGHEIMGRADPAVMLLTNVFIRPTLMIFGLISGILLADVALTVLNSVYQFVVMTDAVVDPGIAAANSGSTSGGAAPNQATNYGIGPFQLICYIIIYVVTIIIIINKAFALIHQIPDQVLRWIGGQHTFGEYSGGEEQVNKMSQAGMSQTSDFAVKSGGKLSEGAEGAMKAASGGGGDAAGGSSAASNVTNTLHTGGS